MKEAKANEPLSTIKFHQLTVHNFYTMLDFSENFKGSGSNVAEYVKPTKKHKIQEQKLGYFLEIFSTDCPDDDDDDDDDVMIVLMNSDGYNDFGINENEMITIIHSKHANDRLKCDGCLFDAGMEKKDKSFQNLAMCCCCCCCFCTFAMAICQSISELLEHLQQQQRVQVAQQRQAFKVNFLQNAHVKLYLKFAFSMAELMSMSDVDHQVVEKQPVDRKAFSPEDVAEMLVAQAGKQK
ncbi:hypothetical protein T09_7681 [Trichinella sp. T9]|nr:hypothetical protein T09_7681 [Trichinella sp. T9]